MSGNLSSPLSDEPGVAVLYGLALECPLGGNPEDCQLYVLRKMSAGDRQAFVDHLDTETRRCLLRHHRACLMRKLGVEDAPGESPAVRAVIESQYTRWIDDTDMVDVSWGRVAERWKEDR